MNHSLTRFETRISRGMVAAVLLLATLTTTRGYAQSETKPMHPSAGSATQAQNAVLPGGAPDRATNSLETLHQEQLEINLAVGENFTIDATGVRSYSLGSDGIAEVHLTPDDRQFVVVGQAPGSTTLLLIKRNAEQLMYTLNVFRRPVVIVERELLELLSGTPGIRVRRVGARFFIEGGVSTEAELARIQHIANLFPGQVDSLVVLGGAAADRKINVRIDFFFVQFDRTRNHQLGVSYPTQVAGPGIASFEASYDFLQNAFTTATASVVNQPLPGLDLAASQGWAKILKHSTVITSNGTEARFSSGGEQNFVVTSGLSASMTALAFGTGVVVLPRFDPVTRELEVRVEAEVSDLTPPVTAGTDIPGRDVSSLKTLVSLKLGQSIVLSGISSRSERQGTRGLPVLSTIPILGALFGSHSRASQEIEGAIVIVPSVVESIPKNAEEVLNDALSQFENFDGHMADVDTWEKAPPSK